MAETMKKLSAAQLELLVQLSLGPQHVVDYYAPAKKLVERGLAEWDRRDNLRITEAGKAALLVARPGMAL